MNVLLDRSIRTLAWLGDASFEKEVRLRVARRGDYRSDRLEAVKTLIVCAESQAALLSEIEGELNEAELNIVRRARNAALPSSAKGRRATAAYRGATAFEALVAFWELGGCDRFDHLLGLRLERAIDIALAKKERRPQRG